MPMPPPMKTRSLPFQSSTRKVVAVGAAETDHLPFGHRAQGRGHLADHAKGALDGGGGLLVSVRPPRGVGEGKDRLAGAKDGELTELARLPTGKRSGLVIVDKLQAARS